MSLGNDREVFVGGRRSVSWIMLIYFFSGACSLIDQVVWVRLLKLTLGNTVYATSIVVSIFMGGLAIGALIMAKYCDGVKRPLRLYALLEILVTISALLLPLGLRLADNVYVWIYRSYQLSHGQLLFVQVLISAGLLLVPTILMGSTLPLLGRFVTSLEKETGHKVGKLYALNTLGAAAGCFVAGFVLIRLFGVMGTLYIAAGLNLLVAFGGWLLSRYSAVRIEEKEVTAAVVEAVEVNKRDWKFGLLVVAFFMSGLICISYELLWMRSIVHLLGGFTYIFSSVLTVYLLGNVIGAGIGSSIVKRLKSPAAGFAVTLALLGIYGIFYLSILMLWTGTMLDFIHSELLVIKSWAPFSIYYIINPFVQCLFLFLVPSIIMGVGFPMALQSWANHMHKVGRSTGTAYGANTIGAVAGGILTGFFLIPQFGLQASISFLGLVGIWIAAVMWFVFAVDAKLLGRLSFLIAAVFLTGLALRIPTDLFDKVVADNLVMPGFKLLRVEEGVTTTVSVHEGPEGKRHLYASGQSLAGENETARADQKILGHFGILLNDKAQRVLSVGFGSGESTACLSRHGIERIDCVEIAPEIVDVSLEYFTKINLGQELYDKVNMIFMDAKNYIHLTDTDYDAIVNDSIHPRLFAENSSLYGKEYFISAKDRLHKREGLFLSWLPLGMMSTSIVDSIIGTTMEVFPHVSLWYLTVQPAPLLVVVASEHEQYFSPKYIDAELAKEGVKKSLAEINIHNSMDVLSCYIADEKDLQKYITTFSVNSDYSPFVEFVTDSNDPTEKMFDLFVMRVRNDSLYRHIDWTGFDEKEKAKFESDHRKLYSALDYLLPIQSNSGAEMKPMEKLKRCMEGVKQLGDDKFFSKAISQAEKELFVRAESMIVDNKTVDALKLATEILDIYPESAIAWMIRSSVMFGQGQMQKAFDAVRMAVHLDPENADANFRLGFMLFRAGKLDAAIVNYKKALELIEKGFDSSYSQAKILDALSGVYAAKGDYAEAISVAEKALEKANEEQKEQIADIIRGRLTQFRSKKAKQKR